MTMDSTFKDKNMISYRFEGPSQIPGLEMDEWHLAILSRLKTLPQRSSKDQLEPVNVANIWRVITLVCQESTTHTIVNVQRKQLRPGISDDPKEDNNLELSILQVCGVRSAV